jgi:flagellar basal-body rod modification protein FlgD
MANTLSVGSAAQTTNLADATASATGPAADKLATKDTFLQLMVAQLRYQNPLNPVDGSSFLAQLSQMSGVEQMVQMRQDMDSMLKIFSAPSATGTDPGSSGSGASSLSQS